MDQITKQFYGLPSLPSVIYLPHEFLPGSRTKYKENLLHSEAVIGLWSFIAASLLLLLLHQVSHLRETTAGEAGGELLVGRPIFESPWHPRCCLGFRRRPLTGWYTYVSQYYVCSCMFHKSNSQVVALGRVKSARNLISRVVSMMMAVR